MQKAVIIGGLIAMIPLIYSEVSGELFTATSGGIVLPGYGTSPNWAGYAALGGFILLLIGLFAL